MWDGYGVEMLFLDHKLCKNTKEKFCCQPCAAETAPAETVPAANPAGHWSPAWVNLIICDLLRHETHPPELL